MRRVAVMQLAAPQRRALSLLWCLSFFFSLSLTGSSPLSPLSFSALTLHCYGRNGRTEESCNWTLLAADRGPGEGGPARPA